MKLPCVSVFLFVALVSTRLFAQDNERTRSIALQAGEVHEITLQLQPKGTDSIGSGDLENEADH